MACLQSRRASLRSLFRSLVSLADIVRSIRFLPEGLSFRFARKSVRSRYQVRRSLPTSRLAGTNLVLVPVILVAATIWWSSYDKDSTLSGTQ